MSNKCEVCGHIIGDTNTTGIGGGCMENIVIPAKKATIKEVYWLDIWKAQVKLVKAQFLEIHKNTNFKSQFRKTFYSEMSTATKVSKKQLHLMADMTAQKIDYPASKFLARDIINDAYKNARESILGSDDISSIDAQALAPEVYQKHAKIFFIKYFGSRKSLTGNSV